MMFLLTPTLDPALCRVPILVVDEHRRDLGVEGDAQDFTSSTITRGTNCDQAGRAWLVRLELASERVFDSNDLQAGVVVTLDVLTDGTCERDSLEPAVLDEAVGLAVGAALN
jgi:hypothetical protein